MVPIPYTTIIINKYHWLIILVFYKLFIYKINFGLHFQSLALQI